MSRIIDPISIKELAATAPVSYEIDTSHSKANFVVRHLMVSNVTGKLGAVTGRVTFDKADPSRSTIEAEIDVTAINTSDEKRDDHLRSVDFLDVAAFPKLTFKSTKVEAADDGYSVTGDLTLRGITRPVTLDVEGLTPEVEMKAWGVVKAGTSATIKLNRKEFGVSWSQLLDNGGAVVGDEVKVTLDIELNRPAPQAASATPAEEQQ